MSLANYTIVELREKLRNAGLKVGGNKQELIDRLQEYYEEEGIDPSDDEEHAKKTDAKKKTKKRKKEEEEDEEDEEEEEVKKPKTKKKLEAKPTKAKATKAKAKEEEEEEDEEEEEEKEKEEDDDDDEDEDEKGGGGTGEGGSIAVDEIAASKYPGATVYKDWGVTLNQTERKTNKNKYYKIQLLQHHKSFVCFTRWGRVSERGQSKPQVASSLSDAQDMFRAKFREKSGNDWDKVKNNPSKFKNVAGLYSLILTKNDSNAKKLVTKKDTTTNKPAKIIHKACLLDKPTQELIRLIFDHDMFRMQMQKLEIDVEKLPLGALSKAQIMKGFQTLDEIEKAIKKNASDDKLEALTNRFFTDIPHAFGRKKPPLIQDLEVVQTKRDMLGVLGDIEMAHEATSGIKKNVNNSNNNNNTVEVEHELDTHYKILDSDLELVSKDGEEWKYVHTYFEMTKDRKIKLLDVWRVNRRSEGARFAEHAKTGNRKLLWHGTNVAVVVAILKSGLRIMPHSGGRVGRGIYFASENAKSANYVSPANDIGIMFLNEVVLGKEHHIQEDDPGLVEAPKGYDSIIAKGWTEPDPSKDITVKIDGNTVIVPQGKPIQMTQWKKSNFTHTEYLVYKESQCRIRYLLKVKWD